MSDRRLTAELSRGTGPDGADEVLLGLDGERHAVSVEAALTLSLRIQRETGQMPIGCNYCGLMVVGIADNCTIDDVIAEMDEHEKTCEENPHRARIAELEAALAEIARGSTESHDEAGEEWIKPLDRAAMMAFAAAAIIGAPGATTA